MIKITKEEAIFCEKSYMGETDCVDCKYYATDTCKSRETHKMAIKALEQYCEDMGEVSDGYHTVNQLYHQRAVLSGMTKEEKIDMLCRLRSDIVVFIPRLKHQYCNTLNEIIEELEQMESSSEKPNKSEIPTDWIPIKTRPMTEEEKEHFFEYADRRCDDTYTILDCPLPDDGQEVILSVNGYVSTDIFCRDSADGCYFESYDIDDVDAWMPFPEPYGESED